MLIINTLVVHEELSKQVTYFPCLLIISGHARLEGSYLSKIQGINDRWSSMVLFLFYYTFIF